MCSENNTQGYRIAECDLSLWRTSTGRLPSLPLLHLPNLERRQTVAAAAIAFRIESLPSFGGSHVTCIQFKLFKPAKWLSVGLQGRYDKGTGDGAGLIVETLLLTHR
jgi:hypothetical protein